MPPSSKAGSGAPARRLVIVESPSKAKTIKGYLGPGYTVEASVGHIRDLPTTETKHKIPQAVAGQPWAKLGVDVDNDFETVYVVSDGKDDQVRKLKALLKDADELYLATDEDREGEAIAWHLEQELKPKVPVRRMVFHEITEDAIRRAVANPRAINLHLVSAQETRRVLDRLYGYGVSPVLWRKVTSGTSAGRVQSVATRLVVDRERERIAFVPAGYWDLTALFDTGKQDDPHTMSARLAAVGGVRVAQGRDFGSDGTLRARGEVVHLDEQTARALAAGLEATRFEVTSVERKPYRRAPYAPFRTTTLQQEASRKLGFSPDRTMSVAQRLYENGFITYMRTDSITLSDTAIAAARSQVRELYGTDYLPDAPRKYESKVKNAQEAHEAIRPAGDTFRTPAQTRLTGDEFRIYELIWMRTVASQMKDATGHSVTVRVGGDAADGRAVEFTASGKIISFHGFLKAYVEGSDDPDADLDDRERRLPQVAEGDPLAALSVDAEGHSTKAPARYTEASLIKELEDREIGRPSTYATIINTILQREYVFKKGTALVPAFLAFSVVGLLEKHFGSLVDYEFTARMEEELDRIALGEAEPVPWLKRFYFGDGDDIEGLNALVTHLDDIDAREVNTFPVADGIVLRVGKWGPYIEQTGPDGVAIARANIPKGTAPDELTAQLAEELLSQPSGDRDLGVDPASGHQVVAKAGRYGPYVTEVLPEGTPTTGRNAVKPRTASLFKDMSLDEIDLDTALKLMSLPRTVGVDPETGEQITAQNGRYGPYLTRGSDTRSLASEDEIFTVTLDHALTLYAQPKARGARGTAKPPLREFGADPVTEKPVLVKDGRFGAYVTDGVTNVTVPRGMTVEELTEERAFEMLAEKRAKGPAPKKKAAAKKTAAKKGAAKKTAAKSTASKTAASKTVASKNAAAKSAAAPKAATKTSAANAAEKSA